MTETIKENPKLEKLLQETEGDNPEIEADLDDDLKQGEIIEEGKTFGEYFDAGDLKELFDVVYDSIGDLTGVPVNERWRKASSNSSYKILSKIKIVKTNKDFANFLLVHFGFTLVQINGMRKNGKLRNIWKKEDRKDNTNKTDDKKQK